MNDHRAGKICEQMREIRSALRDDAEMIVENAKLTVDWRHYVHRYPWLCMAAAAAIGYLVVPRGKPRLEIDGNTVEEISKRIKSTMLDSATSQQTKGFLIGTALPLLGRFALQGGLSLLQRKFMNLSTGHAEYELEPNSTRPGQPR